MKPRSGSRLVEVLVAIFVMGLGLIALLTLFPIGMLRMAQAIHDDKCSTAAANAHVMAIAMNIRNDLLVIADPPYPAASDMFKNPLPGTLKDADTFGESYALFVDPVGNYSGAPIW